MITPHPSSRHETAVRASIKVMLLIYMGFAFAHGADGGVLFLVAESARGVSLTGSGSYDLTGAHMVSNTFGGKDNSSSGMLAVGGSPQFGDAYALTDVSAGSFGGGSIIGGTLSAGAGFGLDINQPLITVPAGYTSGTQLNGTTFLSGATLESLELVPGMYVYETPNDTATVKIIPVPEPSFSLLNLAGLALLTARRQLLKTQTGRRDQKILCHLNLKSKK